MLQLLSDICVVCAYVTVPYDSMILQEEQPSVLLESSPGPTLPGCTELQPHTHRQHRQDHPEQTLQQADQGGGHRNDAPRHTCELHRWTISTAVTEYLSE